MSIEVKIAMLEELVRLRTDRLRDLKERHERDRLSMASILESLEADKKELEQLKKEGEKGL